MLKMLTISHLVDASLFQEVRKYFLQHFAVDLFNILRDAAFEGFDRISWFIGVNFIL